LPGDSAKKGAYAVEKFDHNDCAGRHSGVHFIGACRCANAGTGGVSGLYLFFLGQGCPHCAKAKPYFESLAEKYPQVVLRSYEIYYDSGNQQLMAEMAAAGGFEITGVPAALIGPYYLSAQP
jgi:thiol-disulfide isomerase/thioredoxin